MPDSVNHDGIFRELRTTLLALAAERSEALATGPNGCVKADELALDFDKQLGEALANSPGELAEEQRAALQHVSQQLSMMSVQPNAGLWTDEALRSHPEWVEVGARARAAALLLGWTSRPHAESWPARPVVLLMVLPFALGLGWGAASEGTPWPMRIILGGLALLLTMVVAGALMRTSVEVDHSGELSLRKSILGVDLWTRRFDPGRISAVEFVRNKRAERAGRRSRAPSHRINLVHSEGRLLVATSANATQARAQAERLAGAIGCPLLKTNT